MNCARSSVIATCILAFVILWLSAARLACAEFSFVHPGLLHSREDLERLKRAVAAKEEPISSGFEVFRNDPHSQLSYRMRGPRARVGRNPTVGQGEYDSDANAAYQCAVLWCITGDIAYANKSRAIINGWSATLKSITGRDAVLMAGLGPFKMVNAAEILRHTDANWPEAEIQQAGKHFREVVYPVIRDFAPFANGNWDTAAIKTMMAIGVFCDDRAMFERALRYYLNGAGDGRLGHYVINKTGQCQESGRDQQHTQLGLAHLGDCCEIAWQQGLDLYGHDDNLLLAGFEYTARYNLGESVAFTETLDRTGKYHHTAVSANGRGRFRAVFEEIYNHYANRAGVATPCTRRVVERIRPEGAGRPGADHVGFGTLLFARPAATGATPLRNAPAPPAGLMASGSAQGNQLTWVAVVGAKSYTVKREEDGRYRVIARDLVATQYTDTKVESGEIHHYVVSASNSAGASVDSHPASICAGLPGRWTHRDIGAVAVRGDAQFDGEVLTLEGAGADMGGTNDQCQFAFVPFDGNFTMVARFVPQTSSQFSRFGLMMREGPAADAANVSLLLGPEPSGELESPGWNARLTSRNAPGARTTISSVSRNFSEPTVTHGRLTGACWLKLERAGDTFTGSISSDGQAWTPVGATTVALKRGLDAGLTACSRLERVTTTVRFDNLTAIPTNASRAFRQTGQGSLDRPR